MRRTKEQAATFHCPRWAELPSLSLYMDQVMIVLEGALRPLCDEEEPVVTPTMLNNYVKLRIVKPPVRKKYDREHIASLIVVLLMKRALSMPEIGALLTGMGREGDMPAAYDGFCEAMERTLRQAYAPDGAPAPHERTLQQAALTAWVGKLLVRDALEG